jgi:hypothetical protein
MLLSGETLHHFVNCRLGEEGVNKIKMLLGEKVLKLSQEQELKIDSILLEGSRNYKKMLIIIKY